MSRQIELARKLKRLAEQGIGGEKTTAELLLQKYMNKHSIMDSDLNEVRIKDYYFTVEEALKKLFCQIARGVYKGIKIYEFPKEFVQSNNLNGNIKISCTLAEYIEIEMLFDMYGKLYLEELQVFFRAFCFANDLLVKVDQPLKEISDDQFKEQLRVYNISKEIQSNVKKRRKQLNKASVKKC